MLAMRMRTGTFVRNGGGGTLLLALEFRPRTAQLVFAGAHRITDQQLGGGAYRASIGVGD